ncbi:bifunctional 3-deoxy-7-phosphoheptulonate synthase/chorismate mutase type II [Algoriphagus sp. CAU 1675]|uniref:bifunctional 3-deoxy-7-phosphoheptulonate synthase/chorismate mutase type II n=1 Tax=Algoriphagus sp. CAU 1675 TaxID=3032597 RepID=UPI0023DA1DFD|nr:bifunctional 3-deoxy-7-phosphoheptulonate synthase/chorismate mutase type II [Algoriphagus sp. CAU 1675]MDF2158404.1 bifunctional 3-deoxy-7-phosphoheptulonate synthase/chorismate mutase type II [Algoriphagus sp. CAU 1675]
MNSLFEPLHRDENNSPLIIAGPCSVESPEQLFSTIKELNAQGISIIRGGVWKPRTRPGSFEGLGTVALPWIEEVKKEFPIQFGVEVASSKHVEAALKHQIDFVWIGARSTVNPFTVQEIADSLKGSKIPVLIKNPVNPDLSLWLGAVERIANAGIRQIAAIHRGFSNFRDSIHRNSPMWQLPIEFKSHFPEIPMINDPSHISGKRSLVPLIAQKALDLNFDGLMIESHISPDQAWSDATQQVTPFDLGNILKNLKTRKIRFEAPEMLDQLEEIRHQIDQADHELLEAIHRRMNLVEKIGAYKKLNNVAVLQMERWQDILQSRSGWANSLEISPELVREIMSLIHQESIKKQTEIMDS